MTSSAFVTLISTAWLMASVVVAADTTTLEARFRAMPAQDEVVSADDWYQPTAIVKGVKRASLKRSGKTTQPSAQKNTAHYAAALDNAKRWDTLALVVLRNGQVELEYYAPGITGLTRFDTQSMHRGLLALTVLAALEDGHFESLDAPAARWLPEWGTSDDLRSRITLRDLLQSQSGLSDPPYENRLDSLGLQLFIGTDLRSLLASRTAEVPRATRWRGNAIDSQALGLILERATGEPYARYLSRRIWKRLGASDAVVQLDREGGNTRTFCCLKSTAQDWARVGELVRTGGSFDGRRILQSTTIKELLAPSPLNAASGMSWLLEPVALVPRSLRNAPPVALTPFAEAGVAYIGGRGGQRVYVVPGQDAVVVRIGKIRNDFDDGQFLNPFIDALKSTP